MKLLISIPVIPNGSLNVHLVCWLLEISQWPRVDTTHSIAIHIHEGHPTAETRNRQCRHFLQDTFCDVMLCIDSDQVPKRAGMERMLQHIQKPEVDCVNGWTVMLTPDGPKPVIRAFGGRPHFINLSDTSPLEEMTDWYVGAAALMVTREALKKFRDKGRIWFLDLYQSNPEANFGDRAVGHDANFFAQCRELGIRCWVDTHKDCCWGHIKEVDLLDWYESR